MNKDKKLESIADKTYISEKKKEKKGFFSKIKNYVARNAKKVGVGLGILGMLVTSYFADVKKAGAQEIPVMPTGVYNSEKEGFSGFLKLKGGAFTDTNTTADEEFGDRVRAYFAGEFGMTMLKDKGANDFMLTIFGGYEHILPGRDVSTTKTVTAGAQATFKFNDKGFVPVIVSYQNKDFGKDQGALTYPDVINKVILGIGIGSYDLGEGWFGYLMYKPTINSVDYDYHKDRIDHAVEGYLENLFGDKKQGIFYVKAGWKHEDSQEYFISDVKKLDTIFAEAGVDIMFDENFGAGLSAILKYLIPDSASGVKDEQLLKFNLAGYWRPADWLEFNVGTWYQFPSELSRFEAGFDVGLTFYFPKVTREKTISEPIGRKRGIHNRGGGFSISPCKANYNPKIKKKGNFHKQ